MLGETDFKEECLYCHGNSSFAGACPFCGEIRPPEVQKADAPAFQKPEYYSGKLLELIIAGV